MSAHRDDWFPEILVPVGEAILAGGSDGEREMIRSVIQGLVAFVAQRTLDEDLRTRWFRGPVGRALSGVAGGAEVREVRRFQGIEGLDEEDERVLRLLTQGLSNRQIAEDIGIPADRLAERLAHLYGTIGASSRSDMTAIAFSDEDLIASGRLDRHRCIGAGNCITIALTAFDWMEGDVAKAEVLD